MLAKDNTVYSTIDKEEAIGQIRRCAETIIKNTGSIVGTETNLCDMSVTIHIGTDELPTININRNAYPDRV